MPLTKLARKYHKKMKEHSEENRNSNGSVADDSLKQSKEVNGEKTKGKHLNKMKLCQIQIGVNYVYSQGHRYFWSRGFIFLFNSIEVLFKFFHQIESV